SAFASCESLTELVIPEAVASIDAAAFSGCRKLKSLVIPVSLKTVAAGAFRDCNALTEIYYMGSEADWNQITIVDQYNDALTSATRCFYSETQPTQSGSYWRYVDGVPTKWW
ncbi:MAG: leucine-rich repeat protein, partial [Clostridia bacterium]|nr:leucine-rich repeat protein [Clostridia bacterium]